MRGKHESRNESAFPNTDAASGAPGNEHQVRAFMKQELAKYADDIVQDRLGSVFESDEAQRTHRELW